MISIMPCTAKKAEIKKTGAFYRRAAGCRLCTDHDRSDPYDQRSGNRSVADRTGGTGYAVWSVFGGSSDLFGVTGGVTEAVLRRPVHSSRMEDLQDISFTGIRGIEGIKEASIQLEDRTVKIAVVNGLRCAETLLERIKAGEVQYDFVEVMACKRGCIAGGGQPVPIGPRRNRPGWMECIRSTAWHCDQEIR